MNVEKKDERGNGEGGMKKKGKASKRENGHMLNKRRSLRQKRAELECL